MTSDILTKGTTFANRYRILSKLGQGDRKQTYLAQDTHLGRKVALSVVMAGGSAESMEEWRVFAQVVGHYNIVTLFDRGAVDGVEYLVFEYLSGGTLARHIEKKAEPLAAEDAMRFSRQLTRALAHIHAKGIIHRDVAPANIWLDERRVPHLGDFDSAVRLDSQDDGCRSATTEGYASPEQISGGPVDERSDLYSLGAVLFETLTGQRSPQEDERNARIVRALTERRPVLPRRLVDVICRLLAEKPDDRPSSAEDVLDAIKVARDPLDSEDAWVGTLPFPLASVLWLYLAEPEPAAKVAALLHFFESLAQFAATVLLSGSMSDAAFALEHKPQWILGDLSNPSPMDLRLATFGTWVELTSRLAGTGRRMLAAHGDDAARYLSLFAANDAELIEALVSENLDGILRHTLQCRNEWMGHGGITNPKVLRDRLGDLEQYLTRTRSHFAWSFTPWTLLKPGPAIGKHGVHQMTATILTGANAAFRKWAIELRHPCEGDLLYLRNGDSSVALQLAPLIRMITDDDTGEEACYFYSRAEGDEIRWVSHHYLGVPERKLPDEDVLEILSSLEHNDR